MITASVWLSATLGLALLLLGGEGLVRGASKLAARLGVSPLVVGLTVVAFGTSAPELVVSLQAALRGADDISIGNVVGSNIANIALILALAALVRPPTVAAKVIRVDAPIMIGVSLLLVFLLMDGVASRLDGLSLVVGLVVYVVATFRLGRREDAPVQAEFAAAAPAPLGGLLASVGFVVVGLAALVAGGQLLVFSATVIARGIGVSEAVIGLTIVAVGTSLPEAATSILAALRGQGDIAVGNVIGSNIFNVLGILGVTTLIAPLRPGSVGSFDLGAMAVVAILLGLFVLTQRRVSRVEGALLLVLYVVYTASLSWR